MSYSEKIGELTAEDVAVLKSKRFDNGCLIPSIVILSAAVAIPVFVFGSDLLRGNTGSLGILGGAVVLFLLLLFTLFKYAKSINTPIDQDIWSGRKKVIVGPIESKRTDAIINKRRQSSPDYGKVTMFYFMTVGGKEYPMPEQDYLEIRVSKLMEIHLASASNVVLRQSHIKKEM